MPATPAPESGPLLALHITLNVLGYAAFALSFVLSLIYLVQNQLLRRHRLQSIVWRFPALETLERMSRSGVVVGLLSLFVGIAFGLMVSSAPFTGATGTVIPRKALLPIDFGRVRGLHLWIGRTAAWRGARASALCVVNFVFVLFSYSIVNLYLSSFHRFF